MRVIATRKIDELGRIVLPVDLRREWRLEAGCAVDIIRLDDGTVKVAMSRPICAVCCSDLELVEVKKSYICAGCRKELNAKAK